MLRIGVRIEKSRAGLIRERRPVRFSSGKVGYAYRWVKTNDHDGIVSHMRIERENGNVMRDILGFLAGEVYISAHGTAYGRPQEGAYFSLSSTAENLPKEMRTKWPYEREEHRDTAPIIAELRKFGFVAEEGKDGYNAPIVNGYHINTEREKERLNSEEEARWKSAKPVFLRYGDVPTNGVSRNQATGDVEPGVSVFRGLINEYGEMKPVPATNQEFASMLILTDRPVYIVEGEEVGIGSDGEPVLKNARMVDKAQVIKKLFGKK